MAHAPWELVHKALQEGSALLQGISIRQSSLTPTTAAMGLGYLAEKGQVQSGGLERVWSLGSGDHPRFDRIESRIIEAITRQGMLTFRQLIAVVNIEERIVAYCLGMLEARGTIAFTNAISKWRLVST